VAHVTVAVEVHNGADGLVDGQLLPVDTQTGELGVLVGKVASLQERVVTEADTRDYVAGAKCNLLGLGEKLIGVLVQLELTDVSDGNQLLGPYLSGVKDVELEVVLLGLGNDLNTELPLGVGAAVDSHPQVLAVEVWILTSDLKSLVPDEAVYTELGSEVELDKVPLALVVDECVGVDTETLHHTEGAGNSAVGHGPHEHVSSLGVHVLEVPEVVVGGLGLRNLAVGLGLAGVDDIGKLNGVP
jgi:hypothetical protein